MELEKKEDNFIVFNANQVPVNNNVTQLKIMVSTFLYSEIEYCLKQAEQTNYALYNHYVCSHQNSVLCNRCVKSFSSKYSLGRATTDCNKKGIWRGYAGSV